LQQRDEDLIKYISRKKIGSIKEAAKHSPPPGSNREALMMELSSLLRILTVLTGERKRVEESLNKELDSKNHVITTIPGIGTITASIIIGKVEDIRRYETARKLVAFAGIEPVIKERGKMRLEKSISKRGDPILRSVLYLSAVGATRSNPVIRDFYQKKVREGMPKQKG
jgi:transposase